MTSSFSPLNKPTLDLFETKWAFHGMHFNWNSSHSHPCSHIVVDRIYSHSNALIGAGNDGRSGHDLDLHERKGMQDEL